EMVLHGLVEEVRFFYEQGFEDNQAMKAIGYKELIPYFKGLISEDEAITTLKRNSRRFAKRQYTWFKNKMDIHWYHIEQETIHKMTRKIIQDCQSFIQADHL